MFEMRLELLQSGVRPRAAKRPPKSTVATKFDSNPTTPFDLDELRLQQEAVTVYRPLFERRDVRMRCTGMT
ncbi:hypothetical protein EI94DRAFT_1071894 [Lactarius quietus]|nr:hypothetical protein EI94DRAFT_1071894 [Lactarius quietus]